MDYGYPQFTEAKILSEFIKTDAYRMEVRLETESMQEREAIQDLQDTGSKGEPVNSGNSSRSRILMEITQQLCNQQLLCIHRYKHGRLWL